MHSEEQKVELWLEIYVYYVTAMNIILGLGEWMRLLYMLTVLYRTSLSIVYDENTYS